MSLVRFQAMEYDVTIIRHTCPSSPQPGHPLNLPERQRQSAKELKKEIKKERQKTDKPMLTSLL
jgi:hypothetical protein